MRQAAIRSSETKRTFENNDLSNDTEELVAESTDLTEPIKSDQKQQFANFDQFKKYKQKMREQGRTDQSLIVSIPNISGLYTNGNGLWWGIIYLFFSRGG